MLITAVAGLIFNIIQMTILGGHDHGHHGHDHGHGHGHAHGHSTQEPLLGDEHQEVRAKPKNINLSSA